jgi:hypothetical protein
MENRKVGHNATTDTARIKVFVIQYWRGKPMLAMLRVRGSDKARLAFAVGVFALVLCVQLFGQVTGATLSGTVSDSSGAVVTGAKIVVQNLATGVARSTVTDPAGLFVMPNLVPGNYQLTTTAAGFRTEVRSGILLTVGAEQQIKVELKPGQVSEAVEVHDETAPVHLSTSDLSSDVNATTVRELPLNGRDWTQLATLQPGVVSMGSLQPGIGGGSGSARGNRGFGTQLTITGGRPGQNNYRVDGISVNDYGNSSPGNVLGAALGTDAIQEFSVLTGNYSTEYGRTSGGVVNAVTRNGTNLFHGSVYEFLRNSALDARNYFDTSTIPPFKRNQFGGALGGPIIKDRTFFFADYEGLRQSLGVTNLATVPSLDARNGLIHNTDGTTTTVTVDPSIQRALALWHVPNGSLIAPGNIGTYSFTAQQIVTDNFLTTRLDHHFSEKDNLSGTYKWERALGTLPDSLNVVETSQKTSNQFIALEENHSFSPQLINTFRLGYNRVVDRGGAGISAINSAAADPTLGAIPGRDAPQTFVSTLTTLQGGANNQNNTAFWWNSYQLYDDAFLTKGRHSMKFGVAVEQDRDHVLQFSTVGGSFRFGTLTNFLINQPTSFTATLPQTVGPRHYRQVLFGTYFQDDIRWRPRLTLNLGMRYEISTEPLEASNKLSNLPSPTAAIPHLGSPLFSNPTLRNFEPRVGFAWDTFGNGKTAVRGGFGMFDVLPLLYEYALTELNLYPFTESGKLTNLGQGTYPAGALPLLQPSTTARVSYIQPNPPRNYVMQWNMNIEQALPGAVTGTVAYIGSRGVHQLFRGDDLNEVLPTQTPAGYVWPINGNVLNPNFGRIDVSLWNSNSFYHALQMQLRKRLTHGFQLQGSYTFSRSTDEGSGSALGDPFANSISNLFWFDSRTRRGLSDFNIKHNLVINYIWDIPTVQSWTGPAKWITNGWELGGVFQTRTGLPFTPLISGDPLGTKSSSPFAFPDRLTGAGCDTGVNSGNPLQYIKVGCFAAPNPLNRLGDAGRNSLVGPGLVDFDFSLFKNNYIPRISEAFNIQFRAEVFNVFNRANFNPPTDHLDVFDQTGAPAAGAGLIDSTSTTAREIQFALKVIW